MITVTQSISGRHFSSTLPDLVLSSSEESAKVKMMVGDEEIYSEQLHAVGGKIEISDLSALLTPYAKRRLVCVLTITAEDSESSISESCTIVYCAADIDTTCDDFCSRYFLSLLIGTKTTAMGRLEYLHYIGTDESEVKAYYDDHTEKTFTQLAVGGNDNYTTIDVSPAQFAQAGKTLVRYEVTAGLRVQSFLLDLSCPDCAPVLLFVNSFGVEELLYCTGTHKISPNRKRDTMYVRQLMRNYSIEETRVMEADTGILSFAEAMWAEDLLRSEQVRVVTFKNGEPHIGKDIVITEDKAERTNDDDALPRLSFSYHLAQRNHNVMSLQREGRIFDNTFDNTFN